MFMEYGTRRHAKHRTRRLKYKPCLRPRGIIEVVREAWGDDPLGTELRLPDLTGMAVWLPEPCRHVHRELSVHLNRWVCVDCHLVGGAAGMSQIVGPP